MGRPKGSSNKPKTPPAPIAIGHNSAAGTQIKAIVERVEALEAEKKSLSEDISEVYAEARANGFDVRTLRAVVRYRKLDAVVRQEREAMLDVYLSALGMLQDTPLGQAAVAREFGEIKSPSDDPLPAGAF